MRAERSTPLTMSTIARAATVTDVNASISTPVRSARAHSRADRHVIVLQAQVHRAAVHANRVREGQQLRDALRRGNTGHTSHCQHVTLRDSTVAQRLHDLGGTIHAAHGARLTNVGVFAVTSTM